MKKKKRKTTKRKNGKMSVLTTKWVKGTLTREEVAEWLRKNLDNRDIMLLREDGVNTRGSKEEYDENFEHLLHCLWSIYHWYHKDWQPGHFLSAILNSK